MSDDLSNFGDSVYDLVTRLSDNVDIIEQLYGPIMMGKSTDVEDLAEVQGAVEDAIYVLKAFRADLNCVLST